MDPETWQRAKELFSQALERDPEQRPAFLNQACGDDEDLRQEVENLLAAHEDADLLAMEIANFRAGAAEAEDRNLGRRVGTYNLVKRIGEGGMAAVYLAQRADDQYRKQVAIKLVRADAGDRNLWQRFRNERQTLAALEHPNIVRFLEGGATPEGQPYLVMEYVQGTAITDYADSHRLSIDERLKLFRTVCTAVSYAHQRLVIHRDLKPSNILVAADGTPKLLDFGIAKLLIPEAAATLVVTRTGQRLMTPEYASPEQVRGEPLTNSTDVYSLGVVLYELLTGHRPYSPRSQSLAAMERAICEEEPAKPSTAVSRTHQRTTADGATISVTPEAVSRTRESDPKRLSNKLHGDLDAIVMMALRKEPQRRYASVYEFSEDIGKYLDGLPVKARPNTFLYRGVKLLQRHKNASVAAGAVLVLIGVLAVAGVWYSRRTQPGAPANARLEPSQPSSSITTTSKATKYGWHQTALPPEAAMPNLMAVGAAYASPQLVLFGATSVRIWDPAQPVLPPSPLSFAIARRVDCGSQVWLVHDDHRHLTNWDIAKQRALKTINVPWTFRSAACLDEKGIRWAFLVANPESSQLFEFDAATSKILQSTRFDAPYREIAFDDDRRNLVLVGTNSISVRTRDRLVEVFHDSTAEALVHVACRWSASGRYVALGFKQLLIYDVEQKKRINTLASLSQINDVGWIGDNGVSIIDDRGRLYWTADLSRGWELTQAPPAENVYIAFWDPTNLRWIAADRNGKLFTSTYVTPSMLFSIPVNTLETWSIAAKPAGPTIAVSGKDPRIQLVDVERRQVVQTLEGHTDGVTFVRFDSSHRLISASDDATLRVWDLDAGKLLQTAHGHRSLINAFAISPNGKWLISVSSDKTIKLWELPGMVWRKDLGTTKNSGAAIAFLPGDNERFLVSDWTGWVYLYQGQEANWRLRQQFQLSPAVVYMVCGSRAGWWAALPRGDAAGLWMVPASGIEKAIRISKVPANYCSTSDDGRLTAIVNGLGIEVRSNATGEPESAYYFANEADTVAIEEHPGMVITDVDGNLEAWPLSVNP